MFAYNEVQTMRWITRYNQDIFNKESMNLMIEEGLGVELFSSIEAMVHVVLSNNSASPLSSGLHLPEESFHVNRISREEQVSDNIVRIDRFCIS